MNKKGIYTVVVQVYLNYEIEASSVKEAKIIAENIELPHNYRDNSFEIIEVQTPSGKIYEEEAIL